MATITYTQALQTLTSMFPEMDKEVVTMLLDANRGHMERTVEQLLKMQAEQPSTSSASQNSEAAENTSDDGEDQLPPLVEHKSKESPNSAGGSAEEQKTGAGGAGTSEFRIFDALPQDFLRPPQFYADPKRSQIEGDEMLAQMLQNRLFMAQLRQNPSRYFGEGASSSGDGDETNWKEKMSKLGGSAKAKLAALAARIKKGQDDAPNAQRNSNRPIENRRLLGQSPMSDDEDSALLSRDPDSSFSIGDFDSPPDSPNLRDDRFSSNRPAAGAGKAVELQTIRDG